MPVIQRSLALSVLAAAVSALVACSDDDSAQEAVQIRTLSNRADLVSDGDALVEVVLPPGAVASTL
jgi:hypothetical protein